MALVIKAPLGPQSFGQVSRGILREIFRIRDDVLFFPEGNADLAKSLSAFSRDEEFNNRLSTAFSKRFSFNPKTDTCIRLWHLNGSETRLCNKEILYTFHETSDITDTEAQLANLHDHTVVSSSYSKEIFAQKVPNISCAFPGFDRDIIKFNKEYFPNHIHFGIMGKFEKRKNTAKTINLWAKLLGNNPKFKLTCLVHNPFLNEEQNKHLQDKALDGKKYFNIQFLPYLPKNAQVNDFMSSIDIDLTGLSGGEGWNLPAFNCTALGKWSTVLNATAHKDWANSSNSILVEPSGTVDVEDGLFFKNGSAVNQGHFFDYSDSSFESAIKAAISKAKTENSDGILLQEKFTYKKTAETLLSLI